MGFPPLHATTHARKTVYVFWPKDTTSFKRRGVEIPLETYVALHICGSGPAPLAEVDFIAGLCALTSSRGRLQLPQRLPRVRPPHRSRPCILPQGDCFFFDIGQICPAGGEGNDYLTAIGNDNYLYVCPASALPTALDFVFFRRATRATTS